METKSNKSSNRDPKCQATVRADFKYEKGKVVSIGQLEGTGGFLLLKLDSTKVVDKHPAQQWSVRIFVACVPDASGQDQTKFEWHAPDSENWALVDVPIGFSINNGDALASALSASTLQHPGDPVIVHGHP